MYNSITEMSTKYLKMSNIALQNITSQYARVSLISRSKKTCKRPLWYCRYLSCDIVTFCNSRIITVNHVFNVTCINVVAA